MKTTRAVMRLIATGLVLLAGVSASAQVKETRRLDQCNDVIIEAVNGTEGIPRDLLEKAECVAILPSVKKVAIGIGGRFGKGAVVCRTDHGRGDWGRPLMIGIKGGSFGLQIGGQAADVVLLVMNPKGIDNLLKSQFTLGADASIAAGPVGRTAEAGTDWRMRAEILSYSRTRGLFAGIALDGAVIKRDKDANWEIYGEPVDARELLLTPGQRIPAAAIKLIETLRSLAPARDE